MKVEIKRAYDDLGETQGYRVLVDRFWPRGIKKEELRLDEWAHTLAPSTELRKWFGHDPARWESFRARYLDELKSSEEELARLRGIACRQPLILLYSARDETHNQAVVIRAALLAKTS